MLYPNSSSIVSCFRKKCSAEMFWSENSRQRPLFRAKLPKSRVKPSFWGNCEKLICGFSFDRKSYEHIASTWISRTAKRKMVYCTKCGTQNPDDANVCSHCGAPIQRVAAGSDDWGPYWRHRDYRDREQYYVRRSGGFGALFVGAIVVIFGLTLFFSQYYNVPVNWNAAWAVILILVGLWLILVAFRVRRRHWW
jgi:ribosomal protein L40E